MHFHWKDPNTWVTRPVDRLWLLRARTTCHCLGSGYKHKVAKCCNLQFVPKTQKWGSMHFQWEYAWLSVWHIVMIVYQQRCEIERWFQRTTCRKLHIRAASRTLFFYENLGSTAREFSRKCEKLRCENSTLAIICPLLLMNGIDVTFCGRG